jgi:hypothetical protein
MLYLFAKQGMRLVCIEYTDNVALDLFEYLYINGWTDLEKCDKMYYYGKMDRYGGAIQTYHFDANTKIKI